MVPDIKFPEIVTKLGDLEGGAEYVELNMGANASTRSYIEIRGLKHIDLSNIDHMVNYDESSAIVKDLVNFGGGTKFVIKFWFANETDQGQVINGLTFSIRKIINGVDSGVPDGFVNAGGIRPRYAYYCPENLVKQFGVKIALITHWGDQISYGSSILPGVSPADFIRILVMAPVMNKAQPGTFRSWAQVVEGTKLSTNIYYDIGEPTNLYYPDINPGSAAVLISGIATAIQYNNLNNLKSELSLSTNPWEIGDKTDPAEPPQENDPSGPGGGDGNYDTSSDPIDFPALPTGGALSSGAIKAFYVTATTMTALFNKLWSTSIFDINNFQKLLEAPLDSLIELEAIPLIPTMGENGAIKLGNFDTELTAPVITNQYVTIDCGSKQVKRFWGSALDYEPYTKIEIYLPFIGIRTLHADDIMNTTIHIKYNIDIFTGNLTAQIKCGQSVLYKFTGNCKATIPVSARVNEMMQNMVRGLSHIAAGGIMGGLAGAGTAAISAAVNVAFSKTQVSRSGEISGVTGILDDFVPYLIIHRPVQSLAKTFKNNKGYPCNISANLGSLSGYTEVEYVHLTGISGATDTELQEIEDLLKRGVII